MSFNSIEFIIFLSFLIVLWNIFPKQFKWLPLLVGSYGFYGYWKIQYPIVLLLCTCVTYYSALVLFRFQNKQHRKVILFLSVLCNIGLLAGFKYLNFFSSSLNSLLSLSHSDISLPYLDIIFPVGISFYALQSVSYIVDVYKNKVKPEKHFGYFALYLAFFPQLISGPIERARSLLPQLKNDSGFNISKIYSGLTLFFWGLFKKIVIADRLDIYVDMVFDTPQDYWGTTLIFASYLFTIQIYCDFSGYTDMAIGCSRLFGIELTQNFKFPYFSTSVTNFWRRWHITLTSWLRDYLYIPLGGNRVSSIHWQINIMIVFLLSGLWHGANWTFILWGGLHGLLLLVERQTGTFSERIYKAMGVKGVFLKAWKIFVTFNLVSFAWIFFRANSVSDAFYVITHLFHNLSWPLRLGPSQFTTALTVLLLIFYIILEIIYYFDSKKGLPFLGSIPLYIKIPGFVTGLIIIALFSVSNNPFIYFHF